MSGFSKPLSIKTSSFPNNVVLNNFGLSIKYLNDLHLTAVESNKELRKMNNLFLELNNVYMILKNINLKRQKKRWKIGKE